MVSISSDPLSALRRAHTESHGNVDLALFISHYPALGDDEIADLIELDARERLRAGLTVELSRYLDSIPDLPSRRVALDAAIEFSLRSLSGSRHTTVEAVQTLCDRYPDLVSAISAAWFLNDALGSTTGDSVQPQPVRQEFQLPCGIGPELPTGRRRYELRQRVGVGSHASVYLAVDNALSDPDRPAWVAVKVSAVPGGSGPVSLRVIEEATKARRVTHPNIARVLDRGTLENGHEFVVYEHVDGGDLQDAFDRGRLPRDHRAIARLVSKIARAVQAAHSAGLIHSDLKPSNVLLSSAGEPKVADFGLAARRFDLGDDSGGIQLGTLGFIAPERYRAEPGSESVLSDIYSLGGVLFFLLAGAPPNGTSADEVAERLGADPGSAVPPDLASRQGAAAGSEVDPDLAAICRRALAPRPQDRYASADALANDLDAWVEHRPLMWRKPPAARTAALFLRRNPVVAGAAVAVLACSVGATVLLVDQHYAQRQRLMQSELDNQANMSLLRKAQDQTASTWARGILSVVGLEEDDVVGNWLPYVTVVESTSGPLFFKPETDGKGDATLWRNRIDYAKRVIDAAAATGRTEDTDILMWRTLRGFWLLRAGRNHEASEILGSTAIACRNRLGKDDTWAVNAATLASCATILDARDSTSEGAIGETERARLVAAAQQLSGAIPNFTGYRAGNPIQRMAVSSLVAAYSPGMLDDQEKCDEYRGLQRRLSAGK